MRNRNLSIDTAIKIIGTTIKSSNNTQYLSIIFDKKLQFKEYTQYIVKKGIKFALAILSAAKVI
jgi:hypothetical protein